MRIVTTWSMIQAIFFFKTTLHPGETVCSVQRNSTPTWFTRLWWRVKDQRAQEKQAGDNNIYCNHLCYWLDCKQHRDRFLSCYTIVRKGIYLWEVWARLQREWTNAYSKANNIRKDKHKLCFKLPDDNPQEKKARWGSRRGDTFKETSARVTAAKRFYSF